MQWRDEVADWVRDEILSANEGHWPETREEFERLARRFGNHICYCPGAGLQDANYTAGVFHLPVPGERYPVTHPLYVHELAEACLQWEGREPFAVPPEDFTENRHRVALRVERRE